MAATLVYHRTAERPDIKLWLLDDDGDLIDFSSGYTFSFKLGSRGATAVFTKTSGITGAAGAGTEPDGTPNLTITFTAGELANETAGRYTWQLTATNNSLDRVFQGSFELRDVIT